MAIKPLDKSWGADNKKINYVGKDFATLKQNLIDYTKTYFPNTYSDFNEASPGMVFVEQAAAIGDILSFYQDTQLKESMLSHATERKNVVALAQSMGYKPKVTSPAVTTLTVYQLVPSIDSGSSNRPDENFFLRIKEGMEVTSTTNSGVIFRTIDTVDFNNSGSREIDVFSRDTITGQPTQYLITKKVKAISATERDIQLDFAGYEEYPTKTINDTNIIQITSVTSDGGNTKWYEVPYLAQESVFIESANIEADSEMSDSVGTTPYILEVQKVPHRFSVKVNSDNTMDLQFGSGDTSMADEIILPNTKNIGLGLANSISRLNNSIDPSNFLKTNTFGISPTNKTLTVKYLTGGGISSNVNSGDLTSITRINFEEDLLSFLDDAQRAVYQTYKNSVAVENLEPAVGGRGAESIEEIRQNAIAMFGSQNRAVTKQDYVVRALSMPERYGSVAKVYVSPDGEIDSNSPSSILANPKNIAEFVGVVEGLKDKSKQDIQKELVKYLTQKKTAIAEVNNPFAINMYVLGYDGDKKLTNLNQSVKQNLKTYLGEYRMITDAVNLINGYIINIGLDFEIICYQNYNKNEVITNCLVQLQDYFNIDNWTFNKPINISEIELILANVEGVMSVPSVKIYNLCGGDGNYSPNRYNIDEATKGKIVYPSLDPSIFEIKYPNKDIKGRAL